MYLWWRFLRKALYKLSIRDNAFYNKCYLKPPCFYIQRFTVKSAIKGMLYFPYFVVVIAHLLARLIKQSYSRNTQKIILLFQFLKMFKKLRIYVKTVIYQNKKKFQITEQLKQNNQTRKRFIIYNMAGLYGYIKKPKNNNKPTILISMSARIWKYIFIV